MSHLLHCIAGDILEVQNSFKRDFRELLWRFWGFLFRNSCTRVEWWVPLILIVFYSLIMKLARLVEVGLRSIHVFVLYFLFYFFFFSIAPCSIGSCTTSNSPHDTLFVNSWWLSSQKILDDFTLPPFFIVIHYFPRII